MCNLFRRFRIMNRGIEVLAWAYAIIIGGVLIITPGGIDPIVTKIAGGILALLGISGLIARFSK